MEVGRLLFRLAYTKHICARTVQESLFVHVVDTATATTTMVEKVHSRFVEFCFLSIVQLFNLKD